MLYLRHAPRQVANIVVDLYGHSLPAVLQQKTRKPSVLVDVEEGGLRVQISRLFRAEYVLK